MSTFHEFSPLILTASQNHMLGSVNRLILLMRKQRPKEVKQLASGYTTVKLWGLEIDQVYLTSSSHIWMWELDYKESWAPKNWWIWTVGLEKTFESPLDCKEIKPVHPKGNQSWIFIGRTDAKAETPILWPPDAKNWLIGKDPDARKDWRQEEKGATEDEMVGWHHWLDGHEFVQAPESVMDREAWRAAVHGFARSQTWLTQLNWAEPEFRVKILKHHSVETGHPFTDEGSPKLYTAVSYTKLEQRERQKP